MDRRAKLLDGLDVSRLEGVEIGPLATPIVSKSDGSILYVDHTDTETLRRKYQSFPEVDITSIVEVDAIWGENTIAEALGPGKLVDYVIASHVVEHVPDLISWLEELASVLKPSGAVRLAVPDLRFCFDYRREETRLSDVLTAYLGRARIPQPREVIDFELYHMHPDLRAAWNGTLAAARPPGPDQLKQAFQMARRSIDGEYVDVHCWTFTLASFASIMQHLGRLGLTRLACVRAFDTEVYEHEFFVVMSPADAAEVVRSWGRVYDEAKGTSSLEVQTWPEARRLWLRRGDDTGVERYEAEIAELRREVGDMRSSTSWRLTAPLRAAMRRLRAVAKSR